MRVARGVWRATAAGAIVASTLLSAGCTTTRMVRSAPEPAMRVRVDFLQRRNVVVHVSHGRYDVPFDSVGLVTGKVARASGDTLWLRDVSVYDDSAAKEMDPGPDARLMVTGVGREVSVSEVQVSAGKTTALLVGGIVFGAALAVTLLYLAIASGPG